MRAVNITVDDSQGIAVQLFPGGKKQKACAGKQETKRYENAQHRTDSVLLKRVEIRQKLRFQIWPDTDFLQERQTLNGVRRIRVRCGGERPRGCGLRNALFEQR